MRSALVSLLTVFRAVPGIHPITCALSTCFACRRPTSQQITGRMMNVARQEGLAVNEASMKALVEVHVASLQFGMLSSTLLRFPMHSWQEA